MSRLSKPGATVATLYLIFYDLAVFFGKCDFTGEGIFNTVLLYFIPCGVLTGTVMLMHLYEYEKIRPFAVITAVLTGVMAVIRLLTLIFQFVLIAKGLGETGTQEYFEIAKFTGEILILAAMFFLMLKFIHGGFTKIILALSLVAICTFVVYYIADIIIAVQSMSLANQSGISAFFGKCLTADFVMGIILAIAYLVLFSVATGVFESTTKRINK